MTQLIRRTRRLGEMVARMLAQLPRRRGRAMQNSRVRIAIAAVSLDAMLMNNVSTKRKWMKHPVPDPELVLRPPQGQAQAVSVTRRVAIYVVFGLLRLAIVVGTAAALWQVLHG